MVGSADEAVTGDGFPCGCAESEEGQRAAFGTGEVAYLGAGQRGW